MKPVDFLVLMVLSQGDRHGYGIVQDIESETRGTVRLVPGNLYSVLRRLLDNGVVEESGRRAASDLEDQRRRYYHITPFGRRVLAAEAERLRELVAMAETRNILDRTTPA